MHISDSSKHVRVRFAPSPTGSLHLGGLRTALYNFLLARATGGTFILRIEDTDASRVVPGAAEEISEMMEWAGLYYDEGPGKGGPHAPYVQSERLPLYRAAAERLVEIFLDFTKSRTCHFLTEFRTQTGHAYRCFCPPTPAQPTRKVAKDRIPIIKETSKLTDGRYDGRCAHISPKEADARARAGEVHVVRMKIPPGTTCVKDVVHGSLSFPHSSLDDSVLIKRDGRPTYHLASVVDDGAMRITHVLRGDHLILHAALNQTAPQYAHLPLLLSRDRSKLSKRTLPQSSLSTSSLSPSGPTQPEIAVVNYYAQSGYLGPAVANWVALIGWTPPADLGDVVGLDEMARVFRMASLHKNPGVVNFEKLDFVQRSHMLRWIEGSEGPHGPGSGRKELLGDVRDVVRNGEANGEVLEVEWSDEEGCRILDIIKVGLDVFILLSRNQYKVVIVSL
ncbi:Glutamyl-tRNA synthetase [Gonapodya sp. JEL0774]|nr:Glutamyl-tRNA synthetase [Gonapodya sp. JEL0774]